MTNRRKLFAIGFALSTLPIAWTVFTVLTRAGDGNPKLRSATRSTSLIDLSGQAVPALGERLWLTIEVAGISLEAFGRIPESKAYVQAKGDRYPFQITRFITVRSWPTTTHRLIACATIPDDVLDMSLVLGDAAPIAFRASTDVRSHHRLD
jgi:hypothetical protein